MHTFSSTRLLPNSSPTPPPPSATQVGPIVADPRWFAQIAEWWRKGEHFLPVATPNAPPGSEPKFINVSRAKIKVKQGKNTVKKAAWSNRVEALVDKNDPKLVHLQGK